jgi:hypothetical protein
MAFIITALIVGLLAATVASDHMHPVLAVLLAAPIAFVAGLFVRASVVPLLRPRVSLHDVPGPHPASGTSTPA